MFFASAWSVSLSSVTQGKRISLLTESFLQFSVISLLMKEHQSLCRHFCGREKELEMLHELLLEHGKVFLHGIAGIGKSELAKAYAKQHRKEYTNVLYLTYTGNLMQDIADMDFADDLPDDSEQERFRKHNRFCVH